MITKSENLEVEGMDDRLISAGQQKALDVVYYSLHPTRHDNSVSNI